MELSEIIGIEAVRAPLKATSKKRLLQDLAEMAESVYGLPSETVYRALMDREGLGPTGVGRGVAIPHARFAGVGHVLGLFVRLEKPVDFESIDRQPVDLALGDDRHPPALHHRHVIGCAAHIHRDHVRPGEQRRKPPCRQRAARRS